MSKLITEIIEQIDYNLSRMEDVLKGEVGDTCTNTRSLVIALEDDIHSFARSQAIEFGKWYWSENCHYYWMGGTYSHGETNEVVSTSELYDLFLAQQAKQKEGDKI